jgi:uncharacterized protein YggE
MVSENWRRVAGLVVVGALVGVAGCTPVGTVGTVQSGQQEGIWVSGTGTVTAAPDVVHIRLGIEAQQETVAQAQSDAAAAMVRVMTALGSGGVAEEDIQTQSFSIRQVTRWDRDLEEEIVVGYRVSNDVLVKVREVGRAAALIDAAVVAGGDFIRVDGISFTVDDPTPFHAQARQEAMADAAAKAEGLAELAGVRLGQATFISESSAGQPPVPVLAEMAVMSADVSTPISPGEVEIRVTVQVVYDIR